jgi:hypothetical protein
VVLVGWWRDIDALKTIIPGLIPTIPNTAVAAIIGGLALVSAVREQRDERFAPITRGLAVALTSLGILFFAERVANVDLGIDLLLFGDAVKATPWPPPGRPAINSALIMIVDGAALLAIDVSTSRGRRPAELLSSLGAVIAFAWLSSGTCTASGPVQLRRAKRHGAAHGNHVMHAEPRRSVCSPGRGCSLAHRGGRSGAAMVRRRYRPRSLFRSGWALCGSSFAARTGCRARPP